MASAPSHPTLKLAILDDYQHLALELADWSPLRSHFSAIDVFSDTLNPFTELEALVERLKDYDVISTMRERTPFPETLVSKLPKLKLLTTTGFYNAAFDTDALKKANIIVVGAGGGGEATLELIWALIMGVARNVAREDRNFRPERNSVVGDRKGKWGEKGVMGIGLKGKTLGLMGFGRLGQSTAKIAQVFGMSIF